MKYFATLFFISSLHTVIFMNGMEITVQPTHSDESLFHAICKQNITHIRTLLAQGANPNAHLCENSTLTPFVAACGFDNVEIITLLVNHGANISPESKKPLFIAIASGHISTTRYLMEHMNKNDLAQHCLYAYKNKKTNAESTIRTYFKESNHSEYLKNAIFDYINTYSFDITSNTSVTKIECKKILNHFSDLFTQYDFDYQLKNECDQNKKINLNTIKLLLKSGANPNAQFPNNLGYSTLHIACANKLTNVITLFIKAHADVNQKANNGITPLHIASGLDRNACTIALLINAGAAVNEKNENGCTALHIASSLGYSSTVEALLKAKADPNITMGCTNETALYCASKKGKMPVVELLAEKTNLTIKSTDTGKTARGIALENHHSNIARLLRYKEVKQRRIAARESKK